jgi:Mg-chelatase subunit ChlD
MSAITVTANSYGSNKLAVTIKGSQSTTRQAVHFIFLIDVSGSMEDRVNHSTLPTRNSNSGEFEFLQEGSRLDSVKRSLEFLLPLFTQNDMVTLIEFGDESNVLAKAIQMDTQGKEKFERITRNLKTKGCTNMSSALLKVTELFQEDPDFWASPGHKHGVLLLTDGHANRGVFTPDGLMSIVAKLMTENSKLSLTTVGYGQDHNAELLKQAATTGSGSYNIVNSLEDVATTFGEVFGGLTTVVAQNVTVVLPANLVPMTAYSTDRTDTNTTIRIGDIYAEQEVIVLVESYTGGHIQIIGHDMSDISRFDISVIPESIDQATKPIEIAEFRYKVAELLKTPNKEVAETLLTQFRELSYVEDNIIQMMIEDCETVIEVLEQGGRNRNTEVEMAQHSAYYGLGRGLRCAPSVSLTPPVDPVNPQDLSQSRRTARVDYTSSPFSNQTQQRSIAVMRSRTMPQNQ